MARIKMGSIITDASGSLGGQTIQVSNYGMQLRSKPCHKPQPSNSQSLIRSFNPIMQAGWRSLSTAQRQIWSEYARLKDICNKSGERYPLSGHSLWLKYQYGRLAEDLPFLTNPADYKSQYLGPELIVNGNFTSSAGWSIEPSWTILDGRAHYLDTAYGSIRQFIPLIINRQYRLKFDILSCPGLSSMRFVNQFNVACFLAPYSNYINRLNGYYTIYPVASDNWTRFGFRGNTNQSLFDLDNCSLKIFL